MTDRQQQLADAELEPFDDFTAFAATQDRAMDACTVQGVAAALPIGPRPSSAGAS